MQQYHLFEQALYHYLKNKLKFYSTLRIKFWPMETKRQYEGSSEPEVPETKRSVVLRRLGRALRPKWTRVASSMLTGVWRTKWSAAKRSMFDIICFHLA